MTWPTRAQIVRFWHALRLVVRNTAGREGAVAQEAGPGPLFLSAPPAGAPGATAANSEPSMRNCAASPGAYLGGLLDIWIHRFGKPGSVDRILIHDVEFRQDTARYRPGPGRSRGCCGLAGRPPAGWGSLRCAIARQRESCRVSPASNPGESANGALSGWSVDS